MPMMATPPPSSPRSTLWRTVTNAWPSGARGELGAQRRPGSQLIARICQSRAIEFLALRAVKKREVRRCKLGRALSDGICS